ncbi:ScbA/BarX family gamma-butyrolactone biosynthesis protein [Streptomyces sp. NPDC059957]|uniref:ScbA/BarX family gamma-butyrolactone biosynthesis protein n=1 Tax=unclassified Streptomyces TaxID=2593676 RepID=UPI00365FB758
MSVTIARANPNDLHALLATSVPGEFVHKTVQSEVLLTGWFPVEPDRFRVTARWPVDHAFYEPVNGYHDPLFIAESVRQTVPLLSHVAYDVPFGHRQTWSTFRYEIDPAPLIAKTEAAEVEMDIRCSDVVRRGGRLASVRMRVEMTVDGVRLGWVETAFSNLSPTVYPRLRGPYADIAEAVRRAVPLAPPLAPSRVARSRFADVVLSPTNAPQRTQLRADHSHPFLFDHPVDHAPGMLLLEAARQATHAAAGKRPVIATAMDVSFAQYVEFDAPCWIQAEAVGDRVRVHAEQNGVRAFSALVTATPVPAFLRNARPPVAAPAAAPAEIPVAAPAEIQARVPRQRSLWAF